MRNPVDRLAAELLAAVEEGRDLVEVATDDPALDVEYRIAMRRAEALARGLLGHGRTEPDGGRMLQEAQRRLRAEGR